MVFYDLKIGNWKLKYTPIKQPEQEFYTLQQEYIDNQIELETYCHQ